MKGAQVTSHITDLSNLDLLLQGHISIVTFTPQVIIVRNMNILHKQIKEVHIANHITDFEQT